MLFPYIASKFSSFIDFESCSFNDEDSEKQKTARVVLGNMIRNTGAVLTFEISLYGGVRNVLQLLCRTNYHISTQRIIKDWQNH